MKIEGGATCAQLFPIDLKTGKISGEPIDVTNMVRKPKAPRKPISYGKVKYKVERAK